MQNFLLSLGVLVGALVLIFMTSAVWQSGAQVGGFVTITALQHMQALPAAHHE
jgi:hypothetical protein